MADPLLKTHSTHAAAHLGLAGALLAERQVTKGSSRGNVPPWPGCEDLDFHGTLAAIWVWGRYQHLAGEAPFSGNVSSGWGFVEQVWKKFIPDAIDAHASDEAAYDCAMALRAYLATHTSNPSPAESRRRGLVDRAARLLSAYLVDLADFSGREFRDPGFLVWNLIEYARAVDDRGLMSNGKKFVDRVFGMKAPPTFESEPSANDVLFDFSSTTATRILAVVAGEGPTPFVGAWLRERVAPLVPRTVLQRKIDENTWNCCVAWVLGRAYAIATDPTFLEAYTTLTEALRLRDPKGSKALPRQEDYPESDTLATFYYSLAIDSLVPGP